MSEVRRRTGCLSFFAVESCSRIESVQAVLCGNSNVLAIANDETLVTQVFADTGSTEHAIQQARVLVAGSDVAGERNRRSRAYICVHTCEHG